MAEFIDEGSAIESTTVGVYRTAATVKGGRRFSFSALVVVGDRRGRIGIGYGKANQVPPAIEKAQKEAKRRMRPFSMAMRTIPHAVTGRFGACQVRLIPASPGTGIIAGAAVRAPLELLGLQDCLTKSLGSNNPKNLVKAVLDGLAQLRSKEEVEALRNVDLGKSVVEEIIERGQSAIVDMPTPKAMPKPSRDKKGGRGGDRSGKKKPSRQSNRAPQSSAPAPAAPAPAAPAPAAPAPAAPAPAAPAPAAPAPAAPAPAAPAPAAPAPAAPAPAAKAPAEESAPAKEESKD